MTFVCELCARADWQPVTGSPALLFCSHCRLVYAGPASEPPRPMARTDPPQAPDLQRYEPPVRTRARA